MPVPITEMVEASSIINSTTISTFYNLKLLFTKVSHIKSFYNLSMLHSFLLLNIKRNTFLIVNTRENRILQKTNYVEVIKQYRMKKKRIIF